MGTSNIIGRNIKIVHTISDQSSIVCFKVGTMVVGKNPSKL